MAYRIVEQRRQEPIRLSKDVGFGSLANHFLQRSKVEGADFNLLVIGRAGSGRSTLLSTIYQRSILARERRRQARTIDGLEFVEHSAEIEEAGVMLRLKVTEVLGYGELGFGGSKTHHSKVHAIVKHVESRLQQQFDYENHASRPNAQRESDSRPALYHAALILLQPDRNNSLGNLDKALLQALQPRVNLIPVISKVDQYLPADLARIKSNVKSALFEAKVLQFPNITDITDDDWVIREAVDIRALVPFVLIGAEKNPNFNNQCVREYPWGSVAADQWAFDALHPQTSLTRMRSSRSLSNLINPSTVAFAVSECPAQNMLALQHMLISSYAEFLKQHTVDRIYENYRTEFVCLAAPAPEAPMRLAKTGEEFRARLALIQDQLQRESQSQEQLAVPVDVHAAAPETPTEDEFSDFGTVLEPIREEEEQSKRQIKKKKNRSKNSSKSFVKENDEVKEAIEPPCPQVQ